MSEVEQKFWCQVYVASVRAGKSNMMAKMTANDALSDLQTVNSSQQKDI